MESQAELGAFIRSRRDRVRPAEVGIDDGRPRRVPGLRREELAMLAGLSADYLRRIEQGSAVPAEGVLDALAKALRLKAAEHSHLESLASAARGRRLDSGAPPRASDALLRTLDALAPTPAVVLGRCCEVVAWNAPGAMLDPAVAALPPGRRNVARRVLLDPRSRELYPDWDGLADEVTAVLRLNASRFPGDRELAALIDELTERSEDFRRRWERHDVFEKTAGTKLLDHPDVGRLELAYETFEVTRAPGQTLIVYSAEPGSPTAERLRRLAAIAA
jgi:transcriptional regulator with XRE-family HTH domain